MPSNRFSGAFRPGLLRHWIQGPPFMTTDALKSMGLALPSCSPAIENRAKAK
jgi:hypothetical protein